jgi:hypothetical protein
MKMIELENAYDKVDYLNYLNDVLLGDFVLDEREIELDANSLFTSVKHLGASENCEISVFEAVCAEKIAGSV